MLPSKSLCQKDEYELMEYCRDMLHDFPVKLSYDEKQSLGKAMKESVEYMRLKCMTPTQRTQHYESIRLAEQAKAEEAKKQRASQLKTHTIEV